MGIRHLLFVRPHSDPGELQKAPAVYYIEAGPEILDRHIANKKPRGGVSLARVRRVPIGERPSNDHRGIRDSLTE
jgi:hypothetical protein